MDFILNFHSRVLNNLNRCLSEIEMEPSSCLCAGVAVSGGADSVSLLVALSKILDMELKAVTVNHNIRSAGESSADADYVEKICGTLGVKCVRYDIEPGKIFSVASELKTSLEDAARRVRYEKFDEFIKSEKISFLCLAHNRNDQIETLVMRFLQGASSLRGIPMSRQNFVRPLLDISRLDIEHYLHLQNIDFRNDCTNSDNAIFRNRIRNRLVPFLDREFPGWQTSVFSLAEKSSTEEAALAEWTERAFSEAGCGFEKGCFFCDSGAFFSFPMAVRIRILFRGISLAGAAERIPYSFVADVASGKKTACGSVDCGGLEFSVSGGKILIQKKRKIATESVFFAIIEKPGLYQAGEFSFEVFSHEGKICIKLNSSEICLERLSFPFVFRSRQPDDFVKNADGSFRQVSRILDDWKAGSKRNAVPLIQNICIENENAAQEICCVWGSVLGFKDWIVK
ncbi:tRNA lysidine(34) synthetase TilS [Treponema sp.]|uniref:tRNA lysidine(34) synthetase TilS n=1 Tax=Treponema sp. TaxID=166 RepID=UPI003F00F194